MGNCCFQPTACFSRLSPSTECQDNVPQITQGLPGISCEGNSSASQTGWTQTSYQARSFHAQIKHKFQKPAAGMAAQRLLGRLQTYFPPKARILRTPRWILFCFYLKKIQNGSNNSFIIQEIFFAISKEQTQDGAEGSDK